MKRQPFYPISRFLLIITCLLAGCSSVTGGLSGQRGAAAQVAAPQAEKVALLLPIQGEYANSAQAVRNGFLAAYYYDKQRSTTVPTVTVLNTGGTDVRGVYNQAVNDGSNFVVGPLTKPQVQTLAGQSNLPVTTVALNTLDSNQSVPNNLYFFSLSPREEAEQVAEKSRQDGHQHAIIIAQVGEWGQSIASGFQQRFQASGGQVVDTLYYAPHQDLAKALGQLLHVDKSIMTSQGFKKAQKDKVPLEQLRRQDFDMVFLVATPQQARLIKPLLRFYFAGGVPVYATSSVYSGTPSPSNDRDMDGIIFCDMPWVLANSSQLSPQMASIKSRIVTLWPDSYNSYAKLYAMGIDAYQLTVNFNQLNGSGINAATGRLFLGPQHQIQRQLRWAKFINGVPVLM